MSHSFLPSVHFLAFFLFCVPFLTPLAAEEAVPKDESKALESKVPPGLGDAFEVPADQKDAYGNPIRQGVDEKTGWPLEIRHKATGMHFVFIPSGEFMMGSPANEKDRGSYEGPVHKVKISKAFYMGKYEVTQAEWKKVRGDEPWAGKYGAMACPSNAANYVSWDDCQEFIKKLNEGVRSKALQRLDGGDRGGGRGDESPHYELKFAMPTEAQWEYACRAGTTTRFSYGDDPDYSKLADYAWYGDNAWSKGEKYAHAVGQKKPNPWGLYDVHGNVWEWCGDWYATYDKGDVSDPCGPETDGFRVFRGGVWNGVAGVCRAAFRCLGIPVEREGSLGFRLALSPVQR